MDVESNEKADELTRAGETINIDCITPLEEHFGSWNSFNQNIAFLWAF